MPCHFITDQPYGKSYMSGPHYVEPRRHHTYFEASFPPPNTSFRPIQTGTRTHTSPARIPQYSHPSHKNDPKKAAIKHVHFDLPDSRQSTVKIAIEQRQQDMQQQRLEERERNERPALYRQPTPLPQKREGHTSRPPYPSPPYNHNTYQQHHQHHHYHQQQQPYNTTPTLPPSRPTIYIISYSTDITRTESAATTLLASQVPHRTPPIRHLYTIDARNMQPPSPFLCARYSGIAPLIQDIVMQDVAAQKAVQTAVSELLLRFGSEGGAMECKSCTRNQCLMLLN
ncbi:hypothetical protein COCC4DRAFT_64096 [Bipolaris maydis ATCC 48331]|uniref:Uncharacterized protein n=2 Tax=Cochliobolus heterostrophus TaxID=5016 RepID=M2UN16_COCH5|nr:uncharacterized protein COCC4DRAFT_64096 [Bipolaris maydis ATCC 48331]EMD95001.1 hypothetical protein COCHEDRAFT_1152844 [Bipolaris maydis C5]ENI01708.1 hypothetical protein COCC4DRAFT_64096 [Bipolaris maydis ATCC 48331]KAJ5029389.1 hypothetical protein J3E73DRAFT_388819 [Bipolaris maydis]